MTHRPPDLTRPIVCPAVAFRCEVTAHDLTGSREVVLAHYRAASPRLAARWVRAQSQRLARLLAPEPNAPHLRTVPLVCTGPTCPRPDDDLITWASNDEWYEHAIRVCGAGNDYLLTVTDYDARYSLRVYALPTRRPPQTPAPAGRRTHAPAGAGRHKRHPQPFTR